MDLSVFFAGTAGSVPTARRGLPALLVRRGADRILFDCGEGTQRQLVGSVGLLDLTEVFITHFHADHWLGLPGLLKTFDLRGRERPLAVYGPRGLRELIVLGLRAAGRVRFELDLIELEPGETLERDGYRIAAVPVAHRGPAFGYVLFEDERPGEFDPARARELGLPEGPDWGRVQRGETVGRRRPRAGARAVAARTQARAVRRHDAVRGAPDRRPRSGRARPRGDVRGGRARAGGGDRPLDRRPGRAAARRTRTCDCSP